MIPIINELLDELLRVVVFSKFDLKFNYHWIQVKRENMEKTIFRTHDDHYEFLVMLFRLSNALKTFQSLMNEMF